MTHANAYETIGQQEALTERSITNRIDELIEATDALGAKLQTLRANQTAHSAELIAYQIDGMRKATSQLIGQLAYFSTD
jgi:hypothetical protein